MPAAETPGAGVTTAEGSTARVAPVSAMIATARMRTPRVMLIVPVRSLVPPCHLVAGDPTLGRGGFADIRPNPVERSLSLVTGA